jgi:hypothetical protein
VSTAERAKLGSCISPRSGSHSPSWSAAAMSWRRSCSSSPAGARLVTVTGAGAGGCGKTRLVIEVAFEPSGRFADGAAFVDLSAVEDPALVA